MGTWALAVAALGGATLGLGCASSEEPQVEVLDWREEGGAKPPPPPKPRPVAPKGVRVQSAAPVLPWKGEKVRALSVDPNAARVVAKARASLASDPEVRQRQRQRKGLREAEHRRALARAQRSIEAIEAVELERREGLLKEAAARHTNHHAELRVRIYLDHARGQLRRPDASRLVRATRDVAEAARQRQRACEELALEAEEEVERTRRFALAALARGVPVPGLRRDLHETLRRLTQILVIREEARRETAYALEACERADAAFNPFAQR